MGKSSVGSILWFYISYALCAKGAHGTATGEVQVLVGSNFSSSIGDGLELPWFVEFYSPNCGHCKRLAPIWEQLAGLLQGQVAVAKVDATEEEGLADEWDVTGYPTLILMAGGKHYSFRGGRSLEALKSFALGGYLQTPEVEEAVRPESFGGPQVQSLGGDMDEFVRASTLPVFIVFYLRGCGHCRSMERTWGTLATELKDQVQVASLDAQAFRPLTERWHVDRFPTMKLVKGDEVYDFDGDRTVEDLKAFALDTFRETLPSHKLPAGESHRRPAGERVQEAGPVPSSYWHLVIGFGLGMLCAAIAWAMCLWSPSSKTTPDDDGVKEMKGD